MNKADRHKRAYEAAARAQAIVDRWMEGNVTRAQLAQEFDTTKGTLDQLFVRLRKAGHPIPRKATGKGGGWVDDFPLEPIVIQPGDQWLGIQNRETNANKKEQPAEDDS